MFARLGRLVARGWLAWLIGWILLVAILRSYAPSLKSVTRPGEFDFLPSDVPSRRGAEVFQTAFPGAGSGSSVVLVVYRDAEKLRPADRQFVQSVLAPRLESLPASDKTDAGGSPLRRSPVRFRIGLTNGRSSPGCAPRQSKGWGRCLTAATARQRWWSRS